MGAYPVLFALPASRAFEKLPLSARGALRRRLNELALVAELFSSPAADEIRSTLRFEVDGHVVSYVINDAQRTLTVLSVVRATSEDPPS